MKSDKSALQPSNDLARGGNDGASSFAQERERMGQHIHKLGGSRNSFFVPPGQGGGEGERSPKGRVYAAIEVPEPDDESARNQHSDQEPVFLECVDTTWFHSVQRGDLRASWIDIYQNAPLSVLELTRYPLPPFPDGAQPGDIAWYEFGYERSSNEESDATIYTSLFSDGTAVKISFHEPRQMGWQGNGPMGSTGWLAGSRRLLLQTEPTLKDIRRRLAQVDCSGGVALYDVGQGACQAGLESFLHLPALYIDFGGGVLTNRKTFPAEMVGYCFSRDPMIVLSHWDWDHWSSAYRHESSMSTLWLAPPVPMKPIQQAFAADLYVRGSLAIWDSSWPTEINAGCVKIERCTGHTSNDSGLAVTLKPTARSKKNCLLPGDAAYAHIPSVLAGATFNGIAMTHHGGKLHSPDYPKPKRGGASGLSVGPRNSYKHPFFETLSTHLNMGWKLPLATATSGQRPCHVLLPWGAQPVSFQGGCHGHECSVAISALLPGKSGTIKLARPNVLKKSKALVAA